MIGNNRHSDRTFVSEHICIRLALFAVRPCSLSPSLSPSLFLLPFLPSLSRFRQPSSSRPPVSRFRFPPPSFSFNARASVLLLLSESPSSSLSLSRDPSFLLHRIQLPRPTNDPVSSLATCIPSFLLSSFHPISLSVSFRLSFPGLVHALFSSLCPAGPSFLLYHSPSLSHPPRILFRRCLYIATGWYAGAYIIRGHV